MRYVLRTCNADGTSYGGFQWNLTIGGVTTAPDWDPTDECGKGLHGFLNGEGDGRLAGWENDTLWLVVEPIGNIIDLGRKVKFKSAKTLFAGNRFDATTHLRSLLVGDFAIIGGTSTSGYRGTSTSGDYGTSTSEYRGTSTSGYRGTSTSGDYGTSTSEYRGTSTSGDYGTSTSGDYGTSTSGDGGTSTSGDGGAIVIRWHDGARWRLSVGYIGENGLKPNSPYKLDSEGAFVEVF
jgi:hypothetical protein